jgi:hypothetical protein
MTKKKVVVLTMNDLLFKKLEGSYLSTKNPAHEYIEHIHVGSQKFLKLFFASNPQHLAEMIFIVDEIEVFFGTERLRFFHKTNDGPEGNTTQVVDILELLARIMFVCGFCSVVE